MHIKKIWYDNKKIILRGAILVITLLVTVILPLYIYLETLNLNLDPKIDINSYLNRLERNTSLIIIIGIITMLLLLISFFLNSNSIFKLTLSISIKLLYIFYIIIASNSEIFEIITGNVYLKVDFSALNLFLLGIPILFIIRSIIIYIYARREFLCTLIILETISINNITPKIKIRKNMIKNREINQKIKRYLLKNFNEFIMSLETHQYYPLIVRMNKGYKVTKAGQNVLNHRRYTTYEEEPQFNILQVWTESDLEKLARKRAKSKN